jgi:hypothetical protein
MFYYAKLYIVLNVLNYLMTFDSFEYPFSYAKAIDFEGLAKITIIY